MFSGFRLYQFRGCKPQIEFHIIISEMGFKSFVGTISNGLNNSLDHKHQILIDGRKARVQRTLQLRCLLKTLIILVAKSIKCQQK